MAQLSGDIGAQQDLAAGGVSNFVTSGLTLLPMVVVLFWLDWPMAVSVVCLTVPVALYARRDTIVMRQAIRQARRQECQVSAVLQESLSYVRLVQANSRESHEADRVRQASDRSLTANVRAATLLARLMPSVSLMSSLGYAALVVLGVVRVVGGNLSPGSLLVLLAPAARAGPSTTLPRGSSVAFDHVTFGYLPVGTERTKLDEQRAALLRELSALRPVAAMPGGTGGTAAISGQPGSGPSMPGRSGRPARSVPVPSGTARPAPSSDGTHDRPAPSATPAAPATSSGNQDGTAVAQPSDPGGQDAATLGAAVTTGNVAESG